MIRTLILMLSIVAMVTIGKAQCKYEFKIDDKYYNASEEILNNAFGKAFERLKANRTVKDTDFETWKGTLSIYKSLSCQGTYSWKIFYNRIGDMTYLGTASKGDLGLDENGKTAKGKPNKIGNLAARMAILNHEMTIELTNYFLSTSFN